MVNPTAASIEADIASAKSQIDEVQENASFSDAYKEMKIAELEQTVRSYTQQLEDLNEYDAKLEREA